MQYVLLEAQEAAEQCVFIVLDELSCCWPVSRVQSSPNSTTNDTPLVGELSMKLYEQE